MMFLQTHQEALYFGEIFQNVHFKFLNVLDHLQNHSATVEDAEATSLLVPTNQDYVQISVLSGIGEIMMSIFGDGKLGRCS